MSQQLATRSREQIRCVPDKSTPIKVPIRAAIGQGTQRISAQTDDVEAFQLFQRALTDPRNPRSAEAWQRICLRYEAQVMGWARRHQLFKLTGEEPAHFATLAFTNMWLYFAEGKGEIERFPDLRSLLKFLMVCVNNGVVDHYRKYVVRTEPDGAQAENPVEQVIAPQSHFGAVEQEELWRAIYNEAQSDLERLFIYGYFELLLPRREIARVFPQFDDVDAVKQVMDTLLKRLRRNASLKHFLESYRVD